MIWIKKILRKFLLFFVPSATLFVICANLLGIGKEVVFIGIIALAGYLMTKMFMMGILAESAKVSSKTTNFAKLRDYH